jgi:hypothetical protein
MRCLLPFALVLALGTQDPPVPPPRDGARAPAPGQAASVSGRVTDAESGRPLANAVVMFARALSGPVTPDSLMRMEGYQAVTGPDGRYALLDVPAGEYTVRAAPPSFTATHMSASPGPPGGGFPFGRPSLTLAPGEARVDLDIALPRLYGIEGRVVDETGAPMAGVTVHAEVGPGWQPVGGAPETDDRGVFRVYGLLPGTYRVCASPAMWRPAVRLGEQADIRFVSTCYPAATAADVASPLAITTADLAGIEISMQRRGAYTLTGEVVDASGAAAHDAQLSVVRVEGGGYASIHAEIHDGRFIVRDLADGEYRIAASTGSRQERGRTQIRVQGADVGGIIVRTSPGATVRGRVVIEGTPMTAGTIGRLRIGIGQDRLLRTGPMRPNPADASVARDLTFELTRVFDRGTVVVTGLPDGWAVKSMTWDGTDITDRAVEFVPSSAGVLRVTLTDRVARLRVRLAEPAGQALPPALVLVAPADPARFEGGLRADGKPTERGEVDFGVFVPGDYLVAAVPVDARLLGLAGQSSLEPLFRGAQRVTLSEGDERVVEVQVSSPSGR